MHNLFGDTHSINLEIQDDGQYQLLEPEYGDTITELLSYVHFDANELIRNYQLKIDNCEFNKSVKEMLLDELKAGLTGYSYLED